LSDYSALTIWTYVNSTRVGVSFFPSPYRTLSSLDEVDPCSLMYIFLASTLFNERVHQGVEP